MDTLQRASWVTLREIKKSAEEIAEEQNISYEKALEIVFDFNYKFFAHYEREPHENNSN